ncbi:N-ethylmaleimide reductase [Tritrichomonas foetus]|uniref:N-ethylmaleimide reductase n=1 Tax=Tritrichomonas foetus TaxID=1144522 RepID=A0A1J4KI02_9EUKA|nr:N-ethylmaleimide reductase [Tritrichomonas foetus]|eukprot:OHT11017.1 N-ethylmaleimide reductase [Tritrichomonas foetus]
MSDNLVFSPIQIGSMNLKNRIMRSATHEGTTTDDGFPTKRLLNVIKNLALGDVGLIVPGYFSISKEGIAAKRQSHLFTQEHANSWKDTVSFVHSKGSKIVFQLAHAGIAASKSVGPSQFFKMNDALTIPEIEVIIDDFVKSAKLAYSINVDGVQLHAAHGYLLSEFLSPITNRR